MSGQPDFTNAASTLGFAPITAANTKSDGSGTVGTTLFLIGTAGANGAELEKVEFLATSTAAATAMAQTTARIFISSTNTGTLTSANCILIKEVALPADTGDSSTLAVNPHPVLIGMRLPPNYTVLVTTHVAPNASTAWVAIPYLRNY